jgi:hypothetical protein
MKELGWRRTVHCLRNQKAAREFTVSHEQTEANPAQPRQRLENAGERHLRRPTDCLGKPVRGGLGADERRNAHCRKAVALYEQHLADNFSERDIRHCLHDKDLACWCALDQPCHADVLLRIANSRPK